MEKSTITKEQAEVIIGRINEYLEQLSESKTVSSTRFNAMQTALYGAKCIVRDLAMMPRVREQAMQK